jgi:hypothetical protein
VAYVLWLGAGCWKDKIALAAVEDGQNSCEVVFDRRESVPAGETDIGRLASWFQCVVAEALVESHCHGLAICVSSGDADQTRAAFEGAAAAAAGNAGVPAVLMRRQSMWKPLGVRDSKTATWNAFIKDDALFSDLVGFLKEPAAASLAAARRAPG